MTSTSSDHGSGLSARIRAETQHAHYDAEHTPFVQDLLGGRLPVADYARLAAQHHAVYAVLEEAVAANTDPNVAPFLARELTRLPAIAADLEFLAGPDWPTEIPVLAATDAYRRHVRAACSAWPGALLAHHYVRYLGDLSGGQVIGRVLQRVYRFSDHRGTEFYRFPAIASPKAFKTGYRELLDSLLWDDGDRDRLIDEVAVAFQLNTDVFLELGPLPKLASQRHPAADRAVAGRPSAR